MTIVVTLSLSKGEHNDHLKHLLQYKPLSVRGWEGAANPEPEDLPGHSIIIQLSGERLEDLNV